MALGLKWRDNLMVLGWASGRLAMWAEKFGGGYGIGGGRYGVWYVVRG